MLRSFVELGYSSLIATPHVMVDYYQNTPEIILDKLREVKKAAVENELPLNLYAAAEYLLDDGFERHLKEGKLLTMPDGRSVLIEFGFYAKPMNLDIVLFQLQTAGYQPILAHPERYAYLHRDRSYFNSLLEKGLKFQLNLLSFSGHYGKQVKEVALYLLKNGMVSYAGTDGHNLQHLEKIRSLLNDGTILDSLVGSPFQNKELLSV